MLTLSFFELESSAWRLLYGFEGRRIHWAGQNGCISNSLWVWKNFVDKKSHKSDGIFKIDGFWLEVHFLEALDLQNKNHKSHFDYHTFKKFLSFVWLRHEAEKLKKYFFWFTIANNVINITMLELHKLSFRNWFYEVPTLRNFSKFTDFCEISKFKNKYIFWKLLACRLWITNRILNIINFRHF